ncbi:MAG: PhoH family protein [Proteobacteria bacterium]|nr:PhoH family protein [Pseudomonadota bacterium]MBU4296833.1 PhoH family protein [Pseudomonadota bacterium]MCG2748986.1 PhoH family protein [Desulfobulbaceae bacterium]
MRKYFVLDTNVLLHNADSISSFSDNYVVLPMSVIEELDKFKSRSDELGRNARKVIRDLDRLRCHGRLAEGVEMENGGILKIVTEGDDIVCHGLNMKVADNRILAVAYTLFKQGEKVIFVSKDINARLKADALGIGVMDFEKQKINFDELFSGYREQLVPGKIIDILYEKREVEAEGLELLPNEFVLLQDEADPKHSALARAINEKKLVRLNPQYDSAWQIRSRSKEQRMCLELLLDPSVQLVTLVGQAGTGKTLLALAAALEEVIINKRYEKILVSRPIIPLGKDLGYMPGDKDEKLSHWMQPIFDNLTFLMASGHSQKNRQDDETVRNKVDKLLKDHIVEMEALTYIRGRSISGQFVIVDEAQNLTPHEVKTIISRAGEGTKMVLTGDPYQIDNPYLDSSSNGLTYTVERLKAIAIHGHITLKKSERSELSGVAADYL